MFEVCKPTTSRCEARSIRRRLFAQSAEKVVGLNPVGRTISSVRNGFQLRTLDFFAPFCVRPSRDRGYTLLKKNRGLHCTDERDIFMTLDQLLLRQLYIRKLPLTRYCRSNNCHAFRLPRKGREKRHFNHLINAAAQSSVYGHFIAALITMIIQWGGKSKNKGRIPL